MSKKPTYEELEQKIDELNKHFVEREQDEAVIIQAKEELERTFNSVPDLIAILDDKHRIIRVNRAMADRLGVSAEDAVGLTCYESVHGTQEPPEYCPHSKLLADTQEHSIEIHEKKLGGDFLVTVTPLYDADGHLVGSVHMARDITERKKMEEGLKAINIELKDAHIKVQDAYAQMRDWKDRLSAHVQGDEVGFLIEENGNILGITERVLLCTGCNTIELLGSNILDLVGKDCRKELKQAINNTQDGVTSQTPVRLSGKQLGSQGFKAKLMNVKMNGARQIIVLMRRSDLEKRSLV